MRFGWRNGYALMQERGYHMEAVYDIWDDFIAHMDDEEKPLANPEMVSGFEWSTEQAPEHLHPAQLARLVVPNTCRQASFCVHLNTWTKTTIQKAARG